MWGHLVKNVEKNIQLLTLFHTLEQNPKWIKELYAKKKLKHKILEDNMEVNITKFGWSGGADREWEALFKL